MNGTYFSKLPIYATSAILAQMKRISVINLDDPAAKTVGRRLRPINPLTTADGLQQFINEQFKEYGHRLTPRRVFRFHSHEEADEWMRNSIRPKKDQHRAHPG